ncbi:SRPBCC domain-containing protein [Dyella sp. C11]|uniref:SRPBCC family protein n=1 Tax=Dyella sp. C11 TaxID=2126991 RepID=UPI000D6599A3|nr:SRPBCC domain-containing protein [Dyella sp. C11]
MRSHAVAAAILLSLCAFEAQAEVKDASADHFLIQDSRTIHAPPDKLYAAITDVAHWWNSEHTYSGDASHLSLKADAGGCFCERWDNQSVEHMRVIWVSPPKALRLKGALGPLQSMAVDGVMTFALKPTADGTTLQFEYRVNGSSHSNLDKIAPMANEMLMDQLQRLQHYVESGKPAP